METRNLLPFFSSGKCLTRTEKIVLRAVWFEGFATRAEIGASTGLSRPTIIEAINGLRNRNLIHSSQRKHGLIGRDPECLAVNSKVLYGVGVDIGGTKTSTALVDLRGEIVAETTLPTTRNGAEALVDLVAQMKRHLLDSVGVSAQQVPFAAIGIPGAQQENGWISNTGSLEGLDSFDMRGLFEDQLGCEVYLENDVNMAAYGELLDSQSHSQGTRVLVSVGTGLGMGIVHCGKVLRGATGHAGEIAYLPLSADLQSLEVKKRGAAEMLVSGPVFELRYLNLSGVRRTADQILQLYLEDDRQAVTSVNELAYHLARIVVSVVVMLNPEIVVMAGGLGSNPILYNPLVRAVEAISPIPVKIEIARFGGRAGVVGATTYAKHYLEKLVMTEK